MAGRTKVIGRVSVKVYPDTDQFKRQLRRQLQEIENSEDVVFNAKVDESSLRHSAADALERLNAKLQTDDRLKIKFRATIDEVGMYDAVRDARRRFQSLADTQTDIKFNSTIGDASAKVNVDESSLAETRARLDEWVKGFSPLTVGVRTNLLSTSVNEAETRLDVLTRTREARVVAHVDGDAIQQTMNLLGMLSGGRVLSGIGKEAGEVVTNLDKIALKAVGATLALTTLTSAAMSSVSNIVTFSKGLAEIGPAALALPGILGGVAIGVGATAVALADFNKELPGVNKQLKQMRSLVSDNFWKQARVPMQEFFDSIIPIFSKGIGKTGSSLGGFFGSFAEDLKGALNGTLDGMFNNLNASIDISTKHTKSFADMISVLGSVGSSYLPSLANWFGNASDKFAQFLTTAASSGELQQWINTGIDNLKSLGSLVVSVGSSFASLSKAMEMSGGSTLQNAADAAERMAAALKTPEVQSGLIRAFTGANQAIDNIISGSGPQFESLLKRLSAILGEDLPLAGHTAGVALGSIFDALDQDKVQKSLHSFFKDIDKAVGNLAPVMDDLGRIIADKVEIVGSLAVAISKVLAPAIHAVEGPVEKMTPIIKDLANVTSSALVPGIEALGKVLNLLPGGADVAIAAFLLLRKKGETIPATFDRLASSMTGAQTKITTAAKGIATALNPKTLVPSTSIAQVEALSAAEKAFATASAQAAQAAEYEAKALAKLNGVQKANADMTNFAKAKYQLAIQEAKTLDQVNAAWLRYESELARINAGTVTQTIAGQERLEAAQRNSIRTTEAAAAAAATLARANAEITTSQGSRWLTLSRNVADTAKSFTKGAAGATALLLAISPLPQKMGLANTASLGLMGMLAGPWGAAVGAASGALLDLRASYTTLTKSISANKDLLNDNSKSIGDWATSVTASLKNLQEVSKPSDLSFGGFKSFWGSILSGKNPSTVVDQLTASIEKTQATLPGVVSGLGALKQRWDGIQFTGAPNGFTAALQNMGDIATRIQPAMQALNLSWSDLDFNGKNYEKSVARITKYMTDQNAVTDTAAGRTTALGNAFSALSDETLTLSERSQGLKSALDGLIAPAVGVEQATISWKAALRGVSDEINAQAGLKGYSEATSQNKQEIISLVQSLSELITQQANAGASSQKVAQTFQQGRQSIIDMATAAGLSGREVAQYIKTLGLTPKSVRTALVAAGFDEAKLKAMNFRKAAGDIPKKIVTQLIQNGYPVSKQQITDLAAQYKKNPKEVVTKLTAIITEAQAKTAEAKKNVDGFGKTKANATLGVKGQEKGMADTNAFLRRITGAVKATNSQAGGLGVDFGAGYANGVRAQGPAAYAAGLYLASQAKAGTKKGQQSNSPSKVAHRLGVDWTDGYRNGITSGSGRLSVDIVNMIRTANKAADGALKETVNKRAKAVLDSLTESLGSVQSIMSNFHVSDSVLNGTFSQTLYNASDQWAKDLNSRFTEVSNTYENSMDAASKRVQDAQSKVSKAKQKLSDADGKAEVKAATATLAAYEKQLASAKAQRDAVKGLQDNWKGAVASIQTAVNKYGEINDQLSEAKSQLNSVIDQMNSYKQSLSDSLQSWASILNSEDSSKEGIFAWMDNSLTSLTKFHDGITSLMGMQLPQTLIDQLAQAGPKAQGYIDSLMTMDPATVKTFIDKWNAIAKEANLTGGAVGDYLFSDELGKAQNNVQGLLLELQAVKKPMDTAITALMKGIANTTKVNTDASLGYINSLVAGYKAAVDEANALLAQLPGASQTSATGSASVIAKNSAGTSYTANKSTNTTINVYGATTGNSKTDLFNAGQTVKAVLKK